MNEKPAPARPRRLLSLRLLAYILLFSSLITLVMTLLQLWLDYRRDVTGIEDRLDIIESTTLDSLTSSVWALNEDQISLLLNGMLNLDAITRVELVTDQGRNYAIGETTATDNGIIRRYPLNYRNPRQPGQAYALGTLTVHATLDGVYARLFDKTATILVTQAIKTFLVSIFVLLIVQALITRHLNTIADYARGLALANLDRPLRLNRSQHPADEQDELDQVESAINYMRTSLLEDIAQRETAERRLLQSEARYRQLFDTSMDGLVIFALDGHILNANRSFLDMIGRTLDEARNLNGRDITPPQWQTPDARIIAEEVLQRGYSEPYEKEFLHRDGLAVPVSFRSWVVRNEHGEPQFIMGIARDISREKTLEATRRQLEESMRQKQRLETVGTLAGGIAHDFNNLLTPIKGYAEMLLREAPEGTPLRSRAEAIFHAAERGRKLVEKVLLFSRRGGQHRAPVDVEKVVRETVELASVTRPGGVQVGIEVDCSDPVIAADGTQLHQLVMNLVINAFHAMPGGGRLLVAMAARAAADSPLGLDSVELSFSDTGTGIPPDVLPKIFEPFFTTKAQGKGSGLGLSVVHGIVKSHGGEIDVQSSPEGTSFRVWLPRAGSVTGEA